MMNIETLTDRHLEQVALMMSQRYEEERKQVSSMPMIDHFPSIRTINENGLGVVAMEGDMLMGYLCAEGPYNNAFGMTNIKGVFSPMHGNAAIGNRARVYALMFQAAAEKWAALGVSSLAVCLYAHDAPSIDQFFRYGFGMRCVDAVRDMSDVIGLTQFQPGIMLREMPNSEVLRLWPLYRQLSHHLDGSPTFLRFSHPDEQGFAARTQKRNSRFFVALDNAKIVSYLEVIDNGENIATLSPDMPNICGAFCLPEYRGGLFAHLLQYAVSTLREEGFVRLGVDFESFNPTAWGFWTKHFTPYTYSLVRFI